MSNLVVAWLYPPLPEGAAEELRAAVPGVEVVSVPYVEPTALRNARRGGTVTESHLALAPPLSEEDWAVLERATVVVALDLPTGLLERAKHLKLIQTLAAGVDHIDVAALTSRGVVLSNGTGFQSEAIAEFVLARLLQHWKRLREIDAQQDAQVWPTATGDVIRLRTLAGKTMGVVGLGSIGRATAKLARAFGMRVVATRRSAQPGDTDDDVDALLPAAELDAMLPECDVVVVAAALTPETRELIDERRIALMKPGAVLCNVARGGLLDERALIRALESGHLGAAILDVAQQEPLPAGHPLWTAPNCYLSPHVAAATDTGSRPLVERTAKNVAHLVRGGEIEARVN